MPVSDEEIVTAFYRCIFNKQDIDSAFNRGESICKKMDKAKLKAKILEACKDDEISVRQIANEFGVKKHTILLWLRKEKLGVVK